MRYSITTNLGDNWQTNSLVELIKESVSDYDTVLQKLTIGPVEIVRKAELTGYGLDWDYLTITLN